jgi:hypothetical protein
MLNNNFVRAHFAGGKSYFNIGPVLSDGVIVNNPDGTSVYGIGEFGHNFDINNMFKISPFVAFGGEYVGVANTNDTTIYGAGGTNIEYWYDFDGIKYKYIGRENYAIQGQSWIDTKNMNESKLKHCQNQFDLWEFLVRKVAVESEKQGVDFDKQYLQRAFDEEIDRMNIVTNQGNNAQAVDSIADELAKKLTDEEFDPRDMTRGLEPSKVYWMGDVGILASVPFSDYHGASYGVSFGASYNRCKRLYGLDIDLSFFSKCKKQILAKKGHIDEGDWLTCGAITSYFGYNVYNRDKVALTPFIGVGVRFFDGGERYEEYIKNKNRKHVMYECAGFSTGLGMMIDYKLKHTINSRFKYMGIDATETQLRVKPYICVTRYGDGIGWVPAINLAVGVNTKTYRMKEK